MTDNEKKLIHKCAAYRKRVAELEAALSFHPLAAKLMGKKKNFVVVADDEPYYLKVYQMIRKREIEIGRWNIEDEQDYKFTKEDTETRLVAERDALLTSASDVQGMDVRIKELETALQETSAALEKLVSSTIYDDYNGDVDADKFNQIIIRARNALDTKTRLVTERNTLHAENTELKRRLREAGVFLSAIHMTEDGAE